MKIITTLLLLLSFISMHAQTWFETGDKWVHQYFYPFSTLGYGEMEVVNDTLVNNQQAKLLVTKVTAIEEAFGDSIFSELKHIAYADGNKIYTLNDWNEFELTYDFDLEVGDSIVYTPSYFSIVCTDSIVYTLDSLSTIVLGSENLIVQHFSFYDNYWDYHGNATAIETMGLVEGGFRLQERHACVADAGGPFGLCSFSSGEGELMLGEEDCFLLPTVSTSDRLQTSIRFSPNPCQEELQISSERNIQELLVYTAEGQLVSKLEPSPSLDMSDLQKGIYFVKVIFNEAEYELSRIVKI